MPSKAITSSTDPLMVAHSKGCAELHLEPGHSQIHLTSAQAADELIAALQTARREAFGLAQAQAAVVEVLERGRIVGTHPHETVILPNTVVINGTPVFTASGGVKVHGLSLDVAGGKDMATVTLTLPVRLLTIGVEGETGPYDRDRHCDSDGWTWIGRTAEGGSVYAAPEQTPAAEPLGSSGHTPVNPS